MARSRVVSLPAAERAMKVQDVILKALSGQIKWYQAAQIRSGTSLTSLVRRRLSATATSR